MTAGELIECLKKVNPEAIIKILDEDWGIFRELFEEDIYIDEPKRTTWRKTFSCS